MTRNAWSRCRGTGGHDARNAQLTRFGVVLVVVIEAEEDEVLRSAVSRIAINVGDLALLPVEHAMKAVADGAASSTLVQDARLRFRRHCDTRHAADLTTARYRRDPAVARPSKPRRT